MLLSFFAELDILTTTVLRPTEQCLLSSWKKPLYPSIIQFFEWQYKLTFCFSENLISDILETGILDQVCNNYKTMKLIFWFPIIVFVLR